MAKILGKEEEDRNIVEVGTSLRNKGIGGLIRLHGSVRLVYLSCPESREDVCVYPGVIIPFNAETLKSLCELAGLNTGERSRWACQVKDSGRLRAVFNRSGSPEKAKGVGKRKKVSQKVGCTAKATTRPMSNDEEDVVECIANLCKEVSGDEHVRHNLDIYKRFCVVRTVDLEHVNHVNESVEGESFFVHRMAQILDSRSIMSHLKHYLSINPGGPACNLKAEKHLRHVMPHVHFDQTALKNAIDYIRWNENEAQEFIQILKRERDGEKSVEFLSYEREENSGVLSSVTWSFKGCKDIVKRCNDILFWDSTHNITKYE